MEMSATEWTNNDDCFLLEQQLTTFRKPVLKNPTGQCFGVFLGFSLNRQC